MSTFYPTTHLFIFNHRQIGLDNVSVRSARCWREHRRRVPDVPSSSCLLHGDHLTAYPALAALCRPRVSLAHSHQQSFTHEEKTTTIYFHSLIFPQADKRLSGPGFVTFWSPLTLR